jgi:hypothetical protein
VPPCTDRGPRLRANRRDRVYQGATLSFDLSVEEIWLAFSTGRNSYGRDRGDGLRGAGSFAISGRTRRYSAFVRADAPLHAGCIKGGCGRSGTARAAPSHSGRRGLPKAHRRTLLSPRATCREYIRNRSHHGYRHIRGCFPPQTGHHRTRSTGVPHLTSHCSMMQCRGAIKCGCRRKSV